MTYETSHDLQKKVLDRIKYNILLAENENLRTRSKTFDDMVDQIRKIIEEEVKKCY